MDCRKIGDELGVDWNKVNYDQFCQGMKVEQEHKDITKGDDKMTAKIALAHLREIPDYYTRLEKMEDNAKMDKSDKNSMNVLRRKING